MSSPNEPGQVDRPANPDPSSDVPPWQAGRPPAPSGDPRASRYVTGAAAPDLSGFGTVPQRPDPEPVPAPRPPEVRIPTAATARTESPLPEAYQSELPDLSGPVPRPPAQRRPVPDPVRATAPTARIQVGNRPRGPVRASMQIRRIDPWSALKVSALLSGALFFVWMIAVALLYVVLGAMGVWSKLNSNVGDLLTSGGGGSGDIVSAGSIFGTAALIGLVNIVLLTAMATVGAYIYNLSTDIVGGVEVTLADLD